MLSYNEMLSKLEKNNSTHLLRFYDELSDVDKEKILSQINEIDFELMKKLYDKRKETLNKNKEIEGVKTLKKSDLSEFEKEKFINIGIDIIKNKKIAVCELAGGQGTRLGHNGPKGTLILNEIDKGKSIFELFSDKLKEVYEKYGVKIKWYIMTSCVNDVETREFFKNNNYFEYEEENICFFKQGELPLLDENGKVVLNKEKTVFMAPDGNGGIYEALRKNKIFDDMKENNINYLGIGNVDNILLNLVDPLFIGIMASGNYDLAMKTATKKSPEENVGVVCLIDGKPGVVEYSEITEEMANLRDENNELVYGEANIGCFILTVDLLKRITNKLNYHIALKKNDYISDEGKLIKADKPNTYKFETFIFEGFNASNKFFTMSVSREEEFAPIKNKEGADSIETAVKLYNNFMSKK